MFNQEELDLFITNALHEDVREGDHSSLASIDKNTQGKARLLVKDSGILCGLEIAKAIFQKVDSNLRMEIHITEGSAIQYGDIAFHVFGSAISILTAERLVLNCMQRMSGIATITRQYVDAIKGYPAKILDTRKTTPLFRMLEKEAVRIGGGCNHRMGLYDMVMLKDNHIDFCGGIEKAIETTNQYLAANNLDLKIEVETRNLDDVRRVLAVGKVHRIMLDNYSPDMITEAVALINGQYETEASGGITLENIRAYAATGVDYISVGAITHHAVSMDLSLKAQLS